MTRNAAGQFTPSRANISARSASERLQLVKLGIKARERERDELTSEWRQSLLNDDTSAVERCERQLDALEWKLRRCQALTDLLEPEVRRERQQQTQKTMPTDLPSVLEALQALEPELVRLDSIPWQGRDAGQQRDLDTLRQRQYYLTGLAGRMQPAQETKAS